MLLLTYHLALNQLYEILRRAHKYVLKSPRLPSSLSSALVAFQDPKTIGDSMFTVKRTYL